MTDTPASRICSKTSYDSATPSSTIGMSNSSRMRSTVRMSCARCAVTSSGTSPFNTWPSASRLKSRSGRLPSSSSDCRSRYSRALINSARSMAAIFALVPGALLPLSRAPSPKVAAIMAMGLTSASSKVSPRVLKIAVCPLTSDRGA